MQSVLLLFVFTLQCFKFSWIHDFIVHFLPSITMDFLICFMSLQLSTLKICSLYVQKPIFNILRACWLIDEHLSMPARIFKWVCRNFNFPVGNFLRTTSIFYFPGEKFLRTAGLRAFLLCKHVCHQSCAGISGNFLFPIAGILLFQLQTFLHQCGNFTSSF